MSESLHVLVIELIERRVEARLAQHREKAGNGLDDREYQRMVGRIRECVVTLEELKALKRKALDEIEGMNEEIDSGEDTAGRRKPRPRSPQSRQ